MTQSNTRDRGFTLIEFLVAMTLLVILAAGLLQSLTLIGHHYQRVEEQRRTVLEKWNASRELRQRFESSPNWIVPPGGTRPLYSHRIRPESGIGLEWEVWLGER